MRLMSAYLPIDDHFLQCSDETRKFCEKLMFLQIWWEIPLVVVSTAEQGTCKSANFLILTRHRLGYFRTHHVLGGRGRSSHLPPPRYLENQWS